MTPGKLLRKLVSLGVARSRRLLAATEPEENHITKEHVIWAYRILLDREPEGEAVIAEKLNAWRTTRELRVDILISPEFHSNSPDLAATNERNIVIKEFDNRLRLFIDLSDRVIGLNIIRGRYEPNEIEFVRQTVRPGQTALDIGANIGYFTITMAGLVGPSGRVYAFEPLDENADLLQRSITENSFENIVTLERVAVGQSSGTASLFFATSTINSGGAYLVKDHMEASESHKIRAVKVIFIDGYNFRRPISFIKLDIEGAEPLALNGAEEILRTDRPIILSEVHPTQLKKVSACTPGAFISAMNARGYECYTLNGGKLAGKITTVRGSCPTSVVFLPKAT